MNLRILVASESDEADLAILLGFFERFGCAVGTNKQVGIVVESHAVNLPQIEVIGLQAAQGFFEHLKREAGIAAVRTSLGHQENFVAAAFQTDAHPYFGFSPAVFPAVIKKGDTAIDRLVDDFDRSFLVGGLAQVMASEA